MTVATSTQIGIFGLILVTVFLIIYLFVYIFKLSKKRGQGPDHIELYFDEHFRNIIDEWDLMPRAKIKTWKRDMNKKLKVINRDIEGLKKKRLSINSRLDTLGNEMGKLEEF